MNKLLYGTISFGCDPELFFSDKNNEIIGSEKVLPEEGIDVKYNNGTCVGDKNSKIVIDGVQAELNPRPNTCRANLGHEISACFKKLKEELRDKELIHVKFSEVVKVSKEELDSLSPKSKVFGCVPSKNVHNPDSKITVNPAVYRYRSAGGHLHLGVAPNNPYGIEITQRIESALKQPERTVPMLDIVVGNTCVLVDRDPWAKERRKNYGKAGEYRLPKYGIEYRTPSNFWLRSYQLMSLVMGLARTAVLIIANSTEEDNYEKKILSRIKMDNIVKAINENDFDLAYKNFKKIENFLVEIASDNDHFPINERTVKEFHHFVKKGIDHYFKKDPMEHWIDIEGHGEGIENFLMGTVRDDMQGKGGAGI